MGLRETILAANDLRSEKVSVPEWGCEVLISELNAYDRDLITSEIMAVREKDGAPGIYKAHIITRLLAMAIRDEDGNQVFTQEDVEALAKKSGVVIDRLGEIAFRLTAFENQGVEAARKN